MRIIQINCIYGEGSTGRIVMDLHHAAKAAGESSIALCPLRNRHTGEAGVYTFSNRLLDRLSATYRRVLGRQYDGAFFQTNRLLRRIKREKPDVVHLHCINGNNINVYRLLRYLAKAKIKTVLTLHAEFPYTGGCGHAYDCDGWYRRGCGHCPIRKEATQSLLFDRTARTYRKWAAAYRLFTPGHLYITAVSPWLLGRASQSPMISHFPMGTVMNGIDTEVFRPTDGQTVREELGITPDEKMLFHATASFKPYEENLKGGRFILQIAEKLKDKPIKIVVAANFGDPGELPPNVLFVGRIGSPRELAKYYAAADATLLVSRRETFSMPTAESLSVGTPVVGFRAGGPETVADPAYAEFVPYGDVDALVSAIEKWLPFKESRQVDTEKTGAMYSKESMLSDYLEVYRQLCDSPLGFE